MKKRRSNYMLPETIIYINKILNEKRDELLYIDRKVLYGNRYI
nr:MAG TPA: hypothetical protein [Caudoviricetes sp.]